MVYTGSMSDNGAAETMPDQPTSEQPNSSAVQEVASISANNPVTRIPVRTTAEDENNLIEHASGLLYKLGRVTSKKTTGVERPLYQRAQRRETLDKLSKVEEHTLARIAIEKGRPLTESEKLDALHDDKYTKTSILEQKADLLESSIEQKDYVRQFLRNQEDISVDLGDLGEQTSRMTRIMAPESKSNGKPPMVLIPSITCDPSTIGIYAVEMATRGQDIIIVGHPNATLGTVTQEFVDASAAETDEGGFETMAQFYKKVIDKMTETYGVTQEDGTKAVQIAGYSTGGAIAKEILNDPEYSKKITDALLIAPSTLTNRSQVKGGLGFIKALGQSLKDLARYEFVWGRKEKQSKEQSALKDIEFRSQGAKAGKVAEGWDTARVREGGSINTISFEDDAVTASKNGDALLQQNPQTKHIILPGNHLTPVVHPEQMMDAYERAKQQ